MNDELWDIIEGRHGSGHHDGLVRSLCWGKGDAWEAMQALIDKVKELEHKVDHSACPACGQTPIFHEPDE